MPVIGVLALQGAFSNHSDLLRLAGAQVKEVRTPEQLVGLDGLVLPGGESTTMMLGIDREELADPLRAFAESGKPILATCAGLIILDSNHLGVMPITCDRNAFGRQIKSFETEINLRGLAGGPVHAVFIRAPKVVEHNLDVKVLASLEGGAVAVAWNAIEGYAFHPELTDDLRIHSHFVERCAAL